MSKTCGNCIHFVVCEPHTTANESFPEVKGGCPAFKDKSRYVVYKWISVSDELPKRNGKYLVVANHGAVRTLEYATNLSEIHDDFEDESHNGWFFYDGEYGFCEYTGVTHWMPIPELPKE